MQLMTEAFKGEVLYNEPLARYTSWRVGGPATRLFKPINLADLQAFLRQLDTDEPVFWLGLGSNLLVRDGGIPGTVIATQGCLNELALIKPVTVRAEAGVTCSKVSRLCQSHALVGAEFLAGIPGTMGGALAMNAGAFGGETWDLVEQVETIDRHGEIRYRKPEEYRIGYRSVKGHENEWFVAAHLRLRQVDQQQQETIKQNARALLAERNTRQPIGQASCGSVFRNPEGAYAAELIERTGLKGECVGDACVSDKHANFIINQGKASAADIEKLIDKVADAVYQAEGIQLVREVRIVGEAIENGIAGKK